MKNKCVSFFMDIRKRQKVSQMTSKGPNVTKSIRKPLKQL